MDKNITNEVYEIYYYLDKNGNKYFTPNETYASIRAEFYGTNSYYVEKILQTI